MPYVLRDARGQIDRIHRDETPGAEFVRPDHPDLYQVLGGSVNGTVFAHLDTSFIRVLEDLVDVLVSHNILCITDLPADAQQKLFARKNFRDRFRRNALQLGALEVPLGHDSLIPLVTLPAESAVVAMRPNRCKKPAGVHD